MSLHRILPAAVLAGLLGAAAPLIRAGTPAAAAIVLARGFMFAPEALTVAAGTTVTWTNRDNEPHTVVSDSGVFRSGALDTGESFSFRFDKPGTFHYTCSIHPRMIGTIVVEQGLP